MNCPRLGDPFNLGCRKTAALFRRRLGRGKEGVLAQIKETTLRENYQSPPSSTLSFHMSMSIHTAASIAVVHRIYSMVDGALDVLLSGYRQKIYQISGIFLHVTYYLSFVRKPAANLSKTSFSGPSPSAPSLSSLSYSLCSATGAKISTIDPRRGRWMKVTSSASWGDQDSSAALLRKKRSSGNFIPPGAKAGGNFSSQQKYGEGKFCENWFGGK